MTHVMQNAKREMRTRHWHVAVSVCLLSFVLCIAPARAQLQPGTPGQMGHQTGIVASNVPPAFRAETFAQRLNEQLPLDTMLTVDTGRAVSIGEVHGRHRVDLGSCSLHTMLSVSYSLK